MSFHESFSEVLRAFQQCAGFRRTYNGDVLQQVVVEEIVVDAFNQWVFRAYYYHVYFVVNDELCNAIEVVGFYVDVFTHRSRAGVARGNEQFFHSRTLCYFPR